VNEDCLQSPPRPRQGRRVSGQRHGLRQIARGGCGRRTSAISRCQTTEAHRAVLGHGGKVDKREHRGTRKRMVRSFPPFCAAQGTRYTGPARGAAARAVRWGRQRGKHFLIVLDGHGPWSQISKGRSLRRRSAGLSSGWRRCTGLGSNSLAACVQPPEPARRLSLPPRPRRRVGPCRRRALRQAPCPLCRARRLVRRWRPRHLRPREDRCAV
jgi:hypothetical protein